MARETASGMRRNVVLLGWSSFFNDAATEMAYWLLPSLLLGVLRAGPQVLGLMEGLAGGVVNLSRLASGYITDHFPRRKPFIVFGYFLANLAKPFLALAQSWPQVLWLRLSDRAGAGLRRAPRDTLLAESAAPGRLGAAYGLRQAMDTAGAMLGPLAAFGLLALSGNLRLVFALAAIPGALAVGIAAWGIRETGGLRPRAAPPAQSPESSSPPHIASSPMPPPRAASIPRGYFFLLACVTVFGLGAFSDLFMILRAQSLGLSPALAPLLGIVFNAVFAGLAFPLGRLSDRWPRGRLAALGMLVFALVELGFAQIQAAGWVWLLMAGYGLYHALHDGVLAAWVAEWAPEGKRGRAFGWYSALSGASLALASLWAGLAWRQWGPRPVFLLSAGLALAAALGVGGLANFYPRPPAARPLI